MIFESYKCVQEVQRMLEIEKKRNIKWCIVRQFAHIDFMTSFRIEHQWDLWKKIVKLIFKGSIYCPPVTDSYLLWGLGCDDEYSLHSKYQPHLDIFIRPCKSYFI